MSSKRPRVIGLEELLALRKPLRETPAPLVYFSDREFARLTKAAVELDRRPRNAPLVAFERWPGGGMVQSQCDSPPGQICISNKWTPAGRGHSSGIFFGCTCKARDGELPPLEQPCQLLLHPTEGFRCAGACATPDQTCRLGLWRDPDTGRTTLGCWCWGPGLTPAE